MKLTVGFCILLGVVLCHGEEDQLNFWDIVEPCQQPFVTKDYKPDWLKEYGKNVTLYSVLINKGELYRITQHFYNSLEFKDIKESHLINSCFRVQPDETGRVFTVYGYKEKTFKKYHSPAINSPQTFLSPPTFVGSPGATLYISLSDNKSYQIFTICHQDGVGSFVVVSPNKSIPEDDMKVVKTHLKALGFNEKHFMEVDNFAGCSEDVPVAREIKLLPVLPYILYKK